MNTPKWKKSIINKLNSAELLKFLREAPKWEYFVIALDSEAFDMEIVESYYLNYADGMVMSSLKKSLSEEDYNRVQNKVHSIMKRAENEARIQQRQND